MPAASAAAAISALAGWPSSSPSGRLLTSVVTPQAASSATSSGTSWRAATNTVSPSGWGGGSGRSISALQRRERGKGVRFLLRAPRSPPPFAAAPDPAGDLLGRLEADVAHQFRDRGWLQ